jgi:hypothetical protein
VNAARKNRQRRSEVRAHAKADARGLIEKGLCKAKFKCEELARLPKGDIRKAQIPAQVRALTTVALRWLGDELCMGTRRTLPTPASAEPKIGYSEGIQDYSPDPFMTL